MPAELVDGCPRPRGWALRLPLLIAVLALGVRLWAPGPPVRTIDEWNWMWRSIHFDQAVSHGDFARATAAAPGRDPSTMPGVTTMWAGTIGVRVARLQGLTGTAGADRALVVAKDVVGIACALALWLSIVLAAGLIGRRAALVAGTLLAVEPWLVGHSHLVHTDALVTMFGLAGFLGLAAAAARMTEVGEDLRWWRTPEALGALGGVMLSLSVLTKLNGLATTATSLGGVTLCAGIAAWRSDELTTRDWLFRWLRVLGCATAAFVVTALAVWPALLVAPLEQLRAMRRSLTLVDEPTRGFYDGRMVSSPAVSYYPTVILFRMSPWLLAATLASGATFAWRRLRRRAPLVPAWFATAAALAAAAYTVAIVTATKWYDRYALPLFGLAALAAGVGITAAWEHATARRAPLRRSALPLAVLLTALATFSLVRQSPYAVAYVDPLAGGQARARHHLRLGWGEGVERVDKLLAEATDGRCDAEVVVMLAYFSSVHCGHVGYTPPPTGPYYAIEYISGRQMSGPMYAPGTGSPAARLVGTVEVDGLDYVWLWYVDAAT